MGKPIGFLKNCISVCDGKDLDDYSKIIVKGDEATIVFDYPLSGKFEFKFKNKGGFTLGKIINLVSKTYEKIYKDPQKYGIWGHEMGNLFIEGIVVNGSQVELWIGS
jgi:hypothetical protein